MEQQLLTEQVIGCAMRVHSALGPGYLESVYQNALAIELSLTHVPFEAQKRLPVHYKDTMVGDFIADIVVAEQIIVELKAVQEIAVAHELQLVNYLTATCLDIGLLLNFGAGRLQFKRKHRLYQPQADIIRSHPV